MTWTEKRGGKLLVKSEGKGVERGHARGEYED
jgi:hypothetical protein